MEATILFIIGGLLLASILSSTANDRAAARAWLKPYEPWILAAAIVLWTLVLWPFWKGLA